VFDPTLEVACRALQWWSGEVVHANAYLTTHATFGLALHRDDHDVITVQVAGDKHWEVRGRSPVDADSEPSKDIIWCGTASQGTLMHIPRGCWHQARRSESGGLSLHVTFAIAKRTGVDWLAWIARASRSSNSLRTDLIRFDALGAQNQSEQLIHHATRLLHELNPAAFVEDQLHHEPSARFVRPLAPIDPETRVVCVSTFAPRLERNGGSVIVTATRTRLQFVSDAAAALEMLLSGDPVCLSSVLQRTGYDALGLADVLVRRGVCAVLTPELALGYAALAENATS
jgi:Cupin superfamily protein